ncbi:hypothetical protein IID23_02180 [Patescibacteria group bacterium]|nr:hypothetical protein [Patescibacteria group bacterium]
MPNHDLVEICCIIKHRTDEAILIGDGVPNEDHIWIPTSQIESIEGLDEPTQTILIPEWLAYEKGLI